MESHIFKMYCYFSVHFNDVSNNKKLDLSLNLKKIKMVHTILTEKYFFKE